jgi:hypothetical protein
MTFSTTDLNLLFENILFLVAATSFLVFVGLAWRQSKPYSLPQPLPTWFNIWFLSVQVIGGLLPLLAMLLWGVWWGYSSVLTVLVPYFVMLGLQILSEIVTLRQFQSVAWVMVPYLYVPYRIWQLEQGLTLLRPESELMWVRNLLLVEIILWILNYALALSQLPRLLRWEVGSESD